VSGAQGAGVKSPEELVDDMAAQFQEEMPELMDREKVCVYSCVLVYVCPWNKLCVYQCMPVYVRTTTKYILYIYIYVYVYVYVIYTYTYTYTYACIRAGSCWHVPDT
jgi:hypothetical protein